MVVFSEFRAGDAIGRKGVDGAEERLFDVGVWWHKDWGAAAGGRMLPGGLPFGCGLRVLERDERMLELERTAVF